MNNYLITYTNNKNCYVRVKEWRLHLTLPKILKKQKQEHDRILNILLQKWESLLKKYQWKTFLDIQNKEYLILWGKKVSRDLFVSNNIPNYLKNQLYDYVYPIVQNISSKLWFDNISIRINKVKSKWGSCSHNNKLMFNLLLVHLPKKYTDYVIVHECCHLIHKNHSQDFRNLVSKYYPEYKSVQKELKSFNFW